MFGAVAEITHPRDAVASIPSVVRLRPMRSPKRGRNSEKAADDAKNTVWVVLMVFESAPSCALIDGSAGESMDALNW